MIPCTSCAPANPPHNDGDHYSGTGACSVCDCRTFTAPPIPEHDTRPIDAQLNELRAMHLAVDERLAELHAWTHTVMAQRDAAIMAAGDAAERATSRLDVMEQDLRQLAAQLSQVPSQVLAAPPA